jgi:nucleoside-diphosphate-sugar epimerase
MIIGNGLIAKAFKNIELNSSYIVFASGVSNSKKLDFSDCQKEFNLLKSTAQNNIEEKTLIYFSTYSINNEQERVSSYVQHKIRMENFIVEKCKSYLIIRTSNIVGKSINNSTVFNFLFHKIKKSILFELWVNAYRNFLDVDDLVLMVNELINVGEENKIVYLVNPFDINVLILVEKIEIFTSKKATYSPKYYESRVLGVDKSLSNALFSRLGIVNQEYIERLLEKYYRNEEI